ncbi:SDR family NAD(P)-dependent oxidoreductase [Streptomyces mayteni]
MSRPGHTAVALVTGAGHGLGLEVARQLAAHGTQVYAGARDPEKVAAAVRDADGVRALPTGLDITDQASVAAAVEAIAESSGRLDILVNNAAAHPGETVKDTVTGADLDAAADVMRVNLFGTWRMTQAFLPLLRRSAHPRIVNVSSGAGSHADDRYGFAVFGGAAAIHGVSKAALNAMTAVLAAELADTPIIVNAVCPDVTATVPGAELRGARPVEDSAPGVVWAATLPDDGPRGGLFRDGRPLGW